MRATEQDVDPTFTTENVGPDNGGREKPTKAIIGIALLAVLSLLLYEVNQFTNDSSAPSQSVAQRQISAPAPQTAN